MAMRRWRDLVDPINPEIMRDMAPRDMAPGDMAEIMRGLPGPEQLRAIVERNLRAGGGARLRRPVQSPPARAPVFGRPEMPEGFGTGPIATPLATSLS